MSNFRAEYDKEALQPIALYQDDKLLDYMTIGEAESLVNQLDGAIVEWEGDSEEELHNYITNQLEKGNPFP